MEDSSDEPHKQERALRVIQMSAISGFVEDNRRLEESCLVICNSCREYVPWPCLRVADQVPSTLLAVFLPDVLGTEGKGASRVLPPRRVLKVNWIFDDPATANLVGGEWKEEEEEGEEEEEEEEEEEKEEKKKQEEQEEEKAEEEEKEEEEEDEGKRNKNEWKVERCPLGACDIDMSKVRWPEGVKEIYLSSFNRRLDGVIWPDCLEVLAFHSFIRIGRDMKYIRGSPGIFNKPVDGVTFPAGLRELFLGRNFNQRIDGVAWPEGLERLSLPGFNQPIHDVQWPSGLKTLEFIQPGWFECREMLGFVRSGDEEWGFDQPLDTFLPMSLETLRLSDSFNQSLGGVAWPSGLAVLGLGAAFKEESINGARWPQNLRRLVFSTPFFHDLDAPPGCNVIFAERTGVSDSDPDEVYMDQCWNECDEYGDYDSPGSEFSL